MQLKQIQNINYTKLILSIIICQAVGIIAGILTSQSVNEWYDTLVKPFFTPPSWVFGPVWTIIYLLIGISLYLIWNSKTSKKKVALTIFFVQLVLNFIWSFLFFTYKVLFVAFVEIIALWISIILTMYFFYKISEASAYILIPYLLWVSFATILNLSIVILN